MSRTLASNPNTPPATLAALAADADKYVRRTVARNPSTPPPGSRPRAPHRVGWQRSALDRSRHRSFRRRR